ncbi:MAG TPA: hypothetical protein DCS93_10840 [Microscillaceae bacterium]|nr:hypothetical protein [Microscillaceae bacterium]
MNITIHLKKVTHMACIATFFCALNTQAVFAQKYSPQVKNYFKEIAIGSEYGRGKKIVKWTRDMKIFVMGDKIPEMEQELDKIIKELNQLVRPIRIQRVYNKSQANFYVFFGTVGQYLKKVESNAGRYARRNLAMFYVYYGRQGTVTKGSMYVDTYTMKAKNTRKHLLREELTQALGLMNDSYKYPSSVFYQKFSRSTRYTKIDKQIIRLLYSNQIKPGMSRQQVEQALRNL